MARKYIFEIKYDSKKLTGETQIAGYLEIEDGERILVAPATNERSAAIISAIESLARSLNADIKVEVRTH